MKINSNIPADKALGFEIYHFAWNPRKEVDMIDKYCDMGFMNHFQLPGDDYDSKCEKSPPRAENSGFTRRI